MPGNAGYLAATLSDPFGFRAAIRGVAPSPERR